MSPNRDEEAKPPIRVKLRVGNIEVEVECREDQLQQAVERILASITQRLREAPAVLEPTLPTERADTCKGVIKRLWAEGWFSTMRSLGEVHAEMARRGFHYDRTAVAHALVDLVKEGLLTREGRPRRYRYAQKKPPPNLRRSE